ncbi:MAG: hypothetical protein NWE94_07195 [Candidatus Bathyarchaeota archaeon]|nr:hypothetical protein [Candidatus Bathyarchaeota archaeon]
MPRKTRRKLPRIAIEDLTETCSQMSKFSGKPAQEIFKRYLQLIDKYDYYFFSEPWPAKYDFTQATTFTEEDMQFLVGTEEETLNISEACDRFDVICLKKSISLEGSPGFWGIFWAHHALVKKLEENSNYRQALKESKDKNT